MESLNNQHDADLDGDSLDGIDGIRESILDLEEETNTLVESFHLMAADDPGERKQPDEPRGSFTLDGPLTEDVLDCLPQPLTQLHITGQSTALNPASAKMLARELDWSSLSKLTVENQPKLGPRGMVPLAQAWPRKTLVELHVVGCHLGHFGVQTLAPLLPTSLQVLNLRSNDIGNDGVWKLMANGMPVNLSALDLSNNQIGDDGCSQIAQHLPRTTVRLSHNHIGDVGAHALAQALVGGATLEELWLDHNQIQEDSASALMDALDHCRSVKRMELKGNEDIAESRLHVLDVLLRHRNHSSNHNNLESSMNISRLSLQDEEPHPQLRSFPPTIEMILNVNEATLEQELANLRDGNRELQLLGEKLLALQDLVLKQRRHTT